MLKKVEIEVEDELVQEVIRRYRVHSVREAVHLALRTLVGDADRQSSPEDEYDEFSDPSAWLPHRSSDGA